MKRNRGTELKLVEFCLNLMNLDILLDKGALSLTNGWIFVRMNE